MVQQISTDICVVGAGSAGLSVAAGTSQMGADTVLIERARMGGDCLNYGCVPSKSLLASGHIAHAMTLGENFGIDPVKPNIRPENVRQHVRDVIAGIAPHDSVERFEGLGVKVIQAEATFQDAETIVADDYIVKARRFVLATGSSPLVPPIPGLDTVHYFTNETVFENAAPVPHLLVIGGGPIGLEMAQAFSRLGSQVTVFEMAKALGKDDPEIAEVALSALRAEGISIEEGATVTGVAPHPEGIRLSAERAGEALSFVGSHVLVAVGRKPNIDSLNLDAAGIESSKTGIVVDAGLRTTNKRAFAIGDIAGPYQFTHMAGYHAGIVVRRALFRLPAKVDHRAVPWVTFTDPEVAHVGMTEAEADAAGLLGKVLRFPFADVDRARTERRTEGLVKIILDKKTRVLGASLVGAHAGELLQPWILMITQRLKIGAMANLIAPYPTLGEINKRVAGSYYTPLLFSDRTRRIVRFLRWLG